MIGAIPTTWLSVFLGGVGAILGGLAYHLQRRSEKVSFMEARRGTFKLRQALGDDPRKVEWITWEAKMLAAQADVVRSSATEKNRRRFLQSIADLVRRVCRIVEERDERFRHLNHMLLCCQEMTEWDEAEEDAGREITDAFESHLGPRREEQTFESYIEQRLKRMGEVKDDERYDTAFDKDYFLQGI